MSIQGNINSLLFKAAALKKLGEKTAQKVELQKEETAPTSPAVPDKADNVDAQKKLKTKKTEIAGIVKRQKQATLSAQESLITRQEEMEQMFKSEDYKRW